ncbi:MAG: hypothetical protein C0399_10435 [Syntrophus sp. (in: bacteria)]|nr:hypothetical protein [Syntrophus sp. (in: bacteria)]
MGITSVSITEQSVHFTAMPAAIGSFLTLPEKEKNYSNPIGMFGGIVQQLFFETDASEKSL